MNPLIQVIYASAAATPFTPEALRTLLGKSRSRNTFHGISGVLLYHEGSILQVLEGPEDMVDRILSSVTKDPRHNRLRYLSRAPIQKREFEAWSMGFLDPSASAFTRPQGYLDYRDMLHAMDQSPTHARRMLRFFQEGLYRQQ